MPRDVALFITCLTDQFYPRVGVAVTKVLERLGCRVHFPAQQTCCGQPFYNNGYAGQARELAKRMVQIFEPYPAVVTPSASCCTMVRQHFLDLLGDDPAWGPGVRRLQKRTFEFVEFLQNVIRPDLRRCTLPRRTELTYHYTCHNRYLGLSDETVRLLDQIGNVQLRPLEKADQCCGFGGTFAVKYPAISGAIAEDKAACIQATGAATVVCNEAGCSMNIAGMLHRHGGSADVRHVAEILAESMDIDLSRW